MNRKWKQYLASFIPRYVSNRIVVRLYHVLTWIRVPRSVREKNYVHNLQQLREMDRELWKDPAVCIENQAQWDEIRFGAGRHHSMCYSGCEIIAVFNARKRLYGSGTPEELANLIRRFEAKGAALRGEFGTSPLALTRYLKSSGMEVRTSYGKQRSVEDIERESAVMIATVYNDGKDITKQIHTVCITRDVSGGYVLHNAYCRDKTGRYTESISYPTLREAIIHISGYGAKLLYLIGINRK
ncbi:MAG: hypothetical protein HDR05_11635 [Lachnospiraceae bacterium]|nr:hypothetical protein [Lachnospiraceae bacterium]